MKARQCVSNTRQRFVRAVCDVQRRAFLVIVSSDITPPATIIMSMRTRVLGMVDVIMRVPPLFVIDEILKISMGLPSFSSTGSAATTAASAAAAAAASATGGVVPAVPHDFEDSLLDSWSLINRTVEAFAANGSSAAAAAAAVGGADAGEYVRVLSMMTLKFFVCLLGKCRVS